MTPVAERKPRTARIILARHGRPAIDLAARVSGVEFTDWLRDYDAAPVDAGLPPPPALVEIARTASEIATSEMRRSVESAAQLAPMVTPRTDPDLHEAPVPTRPALPVRLRASVWLRLMRVAWFCGWSPGVESFREARARARRACEQLSQTAFDEGHVLFVGHGMLNGLISRELRRKGWSGPTLPGRDYWSYGVYEHGVEEPMPDVVEVPIEDSIDLHLYRPEERADTTDAYLEAASERGLREVRVIHGRGKGVQRHRIHLRLERNPWVERFADAPGERGGRGATLVWLRSRDEVGETRARTSTTRGRDASGKETEVEQ